MEKGGDYLIGTKDNSRPKRRWLAAVQSAAVIGMGLDAEFSSHFILGTLAPTANNRTVERAMRPSTLPDGICRALCYKGKCRVSFNRTVRQNDNTKHTPKPNGRTTTNTGSAGTTETSSKLRQSDGRQGQSGIQRLA